MLKRLVVIILAVAVALTSTGPAFAQGRALALIRDAETETIIRDLATPLFKAAGLDPEAVKIILVNDRSLNAFVARGQNLFIHTGLLLRADNAGQLLGVIAHETGHIAGGHLARLPEAYRQALIVSLIGLLAGMAAGAAARSGGAVMGSVVGAQSMGMGHFFAFTRSQENQADQAGVTFLERIGASSRGFLEFMEILANQEFMSATYQDPYMRTHPVTRERVDFLRNHLARSRFSNVPVPAATEAAHQRMKAKLAAFLNAPQETLRKIPESDRSVVARYGRAVAAYRIPDLQRALAEIDGLIKDFPKDPYFHELRGQMLLEHGKVQESLPSWRRAVALAPKVGLFRIDLAQALLETNQPDLTQEALDHLREAARSEPEMGKLWRLTAVAHGRAGDVGMAALALAEQAMLERRKPDARDQARRAQRILPVGSPGWLRAQDIETLAIRPEDDQ